MFLAVVPGDGAQPCPASNMALDFVERNELQGRTFGVLSKCDASANTKLLRDLVLNDPTTGDDDLGQVNLKSWVACMLKPPQQNSDRLEIHNFERLFQQAQNEKAFFSESEDEHLRTLAKEKRAGIACLVQQLEEGYSAYLHQSWKIPAMTKILQKLEQIEKEFKDLGVVDEHAQDLAYQEVKKRLNADNGDVKNLYAGFRTKHLSALRSKMETFLKAFTSQPHEVCKLQASLREIQTMMKEECEKVARSVVSHFVEPLQQLLEKEIPRMVRIRGKRNPMALFKENSEIMKNNDFIQLSRCPTFTKTIVEKCRELFQKASKQMTEDSHALIDSFTNMNLPWLDTAANEKGSHVNISCDSMNKFLNRMEVVFLCCLPNDLGQVVSDVQIGPSSPKSKEKADDLKEELQKICRARDGLRKALFSDEELEKLPLPAPTATEPTVGERAVVDGNIHLPQGVPVPV